jgi:methylated-DNA-[protein]-cysteine S-methyltransferase
MTKTKNEKGLIFHYSSPIGPLLLSSDGEALTSLHLPFERGKPSDQGPENGRQDRGPFRDAIDQLDAYFAGELRAFDLPLRPAGTDFQRLAWKALLEIPFGTTISYADQARWIGRPGAARAVGAANGRNPIAVIVPCHRVIGANGALTGYGGGLHLKQWLLEHETSVLARSEVPERLPAARRMKSAAVG